jgi:hypothetical protein
VKLLQPFHLLVSDSCGLFAHKKQFELCSGFNIETVENKKTKITNWEVYGQVN